MESNRDELLRKAFALGEQGQLAEALSCVEECLRDEPGCLPARTVRAGLLADLARYQESLNEVDELLRLYPEAKDALLQIKEFCEAAMKGPELKAEPAPPPPLSKNAIRIDGAAPAASCEVARHWARRLASAFSTRFSGKFDVKEWAADEGSGPTMKRVHWIDLARGSRLQGRARVIWDPLRPTELILEATSEGIPPEKTILGKFFGLAGGLGAVAAFGLWIWFILYDWTRVWNRLSWTFTGSTDNRASKLEVFWFLLGWILGPGFTFFGAAMLGDWCDEKLRLLRVRRAESFARRELDGAIAADLERARQESIGDPKLRAELGLGSPG